MIKLHTASADNGFMRRSPIKLLAAVAVISLLIIPPLAANARSHTVSIVRDGFYAGIVATAGELAFFHIKHHRVYHLRFALVLTCHNSGTGQDEPRAFSAGSSMPQGERIPANGTLSINWIQEDGGRRGHISGELGFHRHWLASFSVISSGGLETCTGFSAVPPHRAAKTPPVPSRP